MKDFIILHYGFEQPTPEEMGAWNAWFESVSDVMVERGGLGDGREISSSGIAELPFASDSITGYTIIQASDLDEATRIAERCPVVASTRVYELRG